MTFEEWLEQQFPDGIGSGFGGSYSQDDMRAAWLAGAVMTVLAAHDDTSGS